MSSARKLNGVRRDDADTWQWGNWELSLHWFVGAHGAHWMACNQGELWSLTQDYRWLFRVLAKLGPDAMLVDGEAFMAAEVQS